MFAAVAGKHLCQRKEQTKNFFRLKAAVPGGVLLENTCAGMVQGTNKKLQSFMASEFFVHAYK
ncbi:MAG: hypothetical protein HYU84_11015 [Chloroflexi bacterium]|nr:hypothetical protein [Chloroflexota bacterium]